jgi:hypothetical protein
MALATKSRAARRDAPMIRYCYFSARTIPNTVKTLARLVTKKASFRWKGLYRMSLRRAYTPVACWTTRSTTKRAPACLKICTSKDVALFEEAPLLIVGDVGVYANDGPHAEEESDDNNDKKCDPVQQS